MKNIPISPIPNQVFSLQFPGIRAVLRVKEARGVMIADLDINGERRLSGVRLVAGEPVIPYEYLEDGNFIFLTVSDEFPDWKKFGVTQSLVYFDALEMEAVRAAPSPFDVSERITWTPPQEVLSVTYLGDMVTYLGNVVTITVEV